MKALSLWLYVSPGRQDTRVCGVLRAVLSEGLFVGGGELSLRHIRHWLSVSKQHRPYCACYGCV